MDASIKSVSSIDKIKSGIHESSAAKQYVGVHQRKSGRWTAMITFNKTRFRLGTYDTREEASMAVRAKKLEFAEWRKSDSELCKKKVHTKCLLLCQPNVGYGKIDGTKYPEEIETVLSPIPAIKRYKGVWRKKSGMWISMIRDPFKNVRVLLGTFETEKEACDAYYLEKFKLASQIIKEPMVAKNLDKPMILEMQSEQELLNSGTEVKDSDSESLNERMNCDSMEVLDEKVQVHGEGSLFSIESIMDNHGFLLGEFSSIDDLSICKD